MPGRPYDAVIGGGGLAGSACALVLREAGWHVAMADDARPQALRVGEALPGAAIRLFRRLGFAGLEELLPAAAFKACTAHASAWGSANWTVKDAIFNAEGGGWHVLRHLLDEAMRQACAERGVDLLRGRVQRLQRSPAGSWQCHLGAEVLEARQLVLATGRAAMLSQQIGLERERLDDQMAAVAWLKAKPDDQDDSNRICAVENGWWYTARLPDGLRVLSFQGTPEEVARLVRDPEAWLAAADASGILPWPLQEAGLAEAPRARDAGVSRLSQAAGPDWIAVGDTALAFDPLSSQGMFFALYSGIRGAEALLAGTQEARASYADRVEQVFRANQGARAYHYGVEQRFPEAPYWRARSPERLLAD